MNETTTSVAEPVTRSIDVPGAVLAYDVRTRPESSKPPLMLIGSPMGAAGFTTLAGLLPGRTLITYDPRGTERSTKEDPTSASTPEQHAEDLHAVIDAVGLGPVDLFASSGGAVNALALAERHPGSVRVLVAHEPPLASILPDREAAMRTTRAIRDTYMRSGFNAAMAHFIAVVSHQGPFPDDYAEQAPPDPAMFGMPDDDDGTRTDVLFAQNLITCTHHEPDFDRLRSASTRILVAAGEKSEGTMASRSAYAVAERLGQDVVFFPSDHGGFLGGEYGQTGEPEAFAARLTEVLETQS